KFFAGRLRLPRHWFAAPLPLAWWSVMALAAAIACGYLLGSIPVGLIFGRLTRGVDVRQFGSGKTGFSNSLRILGLRGSLPVFAGDLAKGVAATLLPSLFSDDPWVLAAGGLAAVIGHIWPVFAGLRGGRGVLTGAGVLVVLDPLVLIPLVAAAISVLLATKIMSVTSLAAACLGAAVLVAFPPAGRD